MEEREPGKTRRQQESTHREPLLPTDRDPLKPENEDPETAPGKRASDPATTERTIRREE